MKLYATTTSERGKDANKGGNERIDIGLLGENKQKLGVIALRYNKESQTYFCLYLHNGITKEIFHIPETKAKSILI